MMKLKYGVHVIVWALAWSARGENLLKNPGFEYEGAWEAHESASLRNQWRSHDGGQYNAAILGVWATLGLNGFIEQRDLPVEAGKRYVFEAWLWADLGWHPVEQYMKVLFYDSGGQVLREETANVPSIHPFWTPVKCVAVAPAGAVEAGVRIGAREVSYHGALTIDDLSFREEAEKLEFEE